MGQDMNTWDAATARRVETVYLTPDVVAQRCETLSVLSLRPGERVLDIGSGPGLLAYDMAKTVGKAGRLCGLDISESFLDMAKNRCAEMPWAEFHAGEATDLPFEDGAFDAAVSTQVYEYVPGIEKALRELHRILRPGGRALIIDTDWDSIVCHTSDPERHARILKAWDEHLHDPYLPKTLGPKLRQAGFDVQRRSIIPILNAERHPNTFSYGLISLIASFVPGRQDITKKEAAAWKEDISQLGEAGSYFFSLNRYLFLAVKT